MLKFSRIVKRREHSCYTIRTGTFRKFRADFIFYLSYSLAENKVQGVHGSRMSSVVVELTLFFSIILTG